MILNFRHKGLKLLFEKGDRKKLQVEHADKCNRMLARLDEITDITQMDLPGFRMHPLKGDLAGFWSITVSSNWRIIFRFGRGHVSDVDLIDYH